jgi:hypothetical protein
MKKKKICILLFLFLFGVVSYSCLHDYTSLNYAKLETLLKAKQWMGADDETSKIIGKSISNSVDKESFLGYSLIDNMMLRSHAGKILNTKGVDCQTLQKIDLLWRQYSRDNFGFKIQSQISKTLIDKKQDGDLVIFDVNGDFAEKVGWNHLVKSHHKDASLYFRSSAWYAPADIPSQNRGFLPSTKWLIQNESPARYSYWLATHHFDLCSQIKLSTSR